MTIIVVTLAVLLMLPIGAWAYTFTNVAITDPGGVNRATVDVDGRLSVNARPVPTRDIWTLGLGPENIPAAGACRQVVPVAPSSKVLVITSLTVYVGSGGTLPTRINFYKHNCTSYQPKVILGITSRETKQFFLPSGVVLDPHESLWEKRSTTVPLGYTFTGYYAPRSECFPPMTVNLCH